MLIDFLRREKVAVPKKAGILAPELIGDRLSTDVLAQVRFPRRQILERAIECAIENDYHGIRELVPPSRIVGATLAPLVLS